MYRITTNGGRALWDPAADITLIEPKLELKINSAGALTFSMDPTHHLYGTLEKYTSYIDITQNGVWLWSGRVLNTTVNTENIIQVQAEGEQAYLNDIIQRPKEYHNISIRDYLVDVVENLYNPQVPIERRFKIGTVTVTDSNNSIYKISNYDNTWDLLNDRLLGTFGGVFRIRHDGNVKYLDYLKDYSGINTQHISYGENLLDMLLSVDGEDFATAVIPLGERDQDTDTRLTIASVNGGKDYVQDDGLVAKYGLIVKVVQHDDVTLPQNLKTKGLEDLAKCKVFNGNIEVRAVDLNVIDSEIESFRVGDMVFMDSAPHGLDMQLLLDKITIPFNRPEDTEITLGADFTTLTDSKLHADKVINEIKADYVTNQQLNNTVSEKISKAVKSGLVEYYLSDSFTEVTGGEWSAVSPVWTAGKYIWQRTKTTYIDNTYSLSEPVCISGKDSIQFYTWIKYADTPTSGMSDSPEGKAYIGLAYNKASSEESINYGDYTWSLIKGQDGEAAKSVKLVSSVQSFKSMDGGATFTPEESEITAICQNTELYRWEYSTDGNAFQVLDPATISGNTVKVGKDSDIFDGGTAVTIRALAKDSSLPPYRIGVLEGSDLQFDDAESGYDLLVTADADCTVTRCGRNLLDNTLSDSPNSTRPCNIFPGTFYYRRFVPEGDENKYTSSLRYQSGNDWIPITPNGNSDGDNIITEGSMGWYQTQQKITFKKNYAIRSARESESVQLMLTTDSYAESYEPYRGTEYELYAGQPLRIPSLEGINTVFADCNLHIEYRKRADAEILPSDLLSPTENWPIDTPYQDTLTLTKIADGKGITEVTAEYAISESKTEVPIDGWLPDPPLWTPNHYLWSRSRIGYSDGSVEYTTPYCDSSWEAVNIVQQAVEKNTAEIKQLPDQILAEVSREYSKVSSVDYIQNLINGTALKWSGTGVPTVGANTGMWYSVPKTIPFKLAQWGFWPGGEIDKDHIGDIYTDTSTDKKYVFRTNEAGDFLWEYLEENAYLYDVARLDMKSDKINLSVNKISSDIGKQSAELTVMSDRISSKVAKGDVVSEINQTGDRITLSGNRIVINSTYFSVSADGHITATGGTIGGFSISAEYLANNTDRINYLGEGGVTPDGTPDQCVYVGTDGISLGRNAKIKNNGVAYFQEMISTGHFDGVSGVTNGHAGMITTKINKSSIFIDFVADNPGYANSSGGIFYQDRSYSSARAVGLAFKGNWGQFGTLIAEDNFYFRGKYYQPDSNGYLRSL